MNNRHQRHTTRDIWQDGFSMTVYHAIDLGVHLKDLPMNESLRVAFLCAKVYSGRVLYIILDQIIGSGYARWSEIATHDVSVWISRVPDRDMAVRIDDAMVVKNVVCCDELAFQLGGLSVRSVKREVLTELTSARLSVAVGS
jgi:hypothetical protein